MLFRIFYYQPVLCSKAAAPAWSLKLCHTGDNPYAIPKNRIVRLWQRFQLNHPGFLFYSGLATVVLILVSPWIMHTSKYFTMTREEYNQYCEEVYAQNIRRARYGEGMKLPFLTFDLISKEKIAEEERFHEQRVAEIRAKVEERKRKSKMVEAKTEEE